MFKNDETKATGKLTVEIKDKHGNVKETREVKNLVVDTGLAFIASRMKDATATAMSHMGIGTGNTAAAASDTACRVRSGTGRELTTKELKQVPVRAVVILCCCCTS